MIICIIELGTGLLACSFATLRPLLSSLVDMTASSRHALSNIIFNRSHQKDSNGHSIGDNGIPSPPLGKEEHNDLSILQSKTRDLESGGDNELEIFASKGVTIINTERGRSEGSDVSLVYQK
jgi:hypothetical protein